MGLSWSDTAPPDDLCRYHHVVAKTPLGEIFIEWKGWKAVPSFTAQLPWGDWVVGDDLADAKRLVQKAWNKKAAEIQALAVEAYEKAKGDDDA